MANLSLARAASAMRDALRPPTFRCCECRLVFPRTVFHLPEAHGGIECDACRNAAAAWHIDANDLEYPDDRR